MSSDFDALAAGLRAHEQGDRRKALRQLAESEDPRAVEALISVTASQGDPLRVEGVVALGSRAEPCNAQRVGCLVGLLDDPDSGMKQAAVKAVVALKASAAVDALSALLVRVWDEGDEDLGPLVAWALGEIGDQRAIPALVEVLGQDWDCGFYFFIHREALFSLAEVGCHEPIEAFIADPARDDDLREEAAKFILPRAKANRQERQEKQSPPDG